MTSYNTDRSFSDGILVTVSEKISDKERWRSVKELRSNFVVPGFDADKTVGIGRYKSIGIDNDNYSFVGPVINNKLTLIPYKGARQVPEEFEVLVLNPEQFEWKKTDKSKVLLPPDAFFTGVKTDFGAAYIGKHDQCGIGMVLELETNEGDVWTYISKDGEKFNSFDVLCYK